MAGPGVERPGVEGPAVEAPGVGGRGGRVGMATVALLLVLAVAGCAGRGADADGPAVPPAAAAGAATPAEDSADARLVALLDREMERTIARHPELATRLGRDTHKDRWDDWSDAFAVLEHQRDRAFLAALDRIDPATLSPAARGFHAVARYSAADAIEDFRWRFHAYAIDPLNSPLDEAAALLVNAHAIAGVADAEAYIARVAGIGTPVAALVENMQVREAKGVLPPRFAFGQVVDNLEGQLRGRPFATGGATDSTLRADFIAKVDALALDAATGAGLVARLDAALLEHWGPALRRVIALLRDQATRADDRDGVWKLPDGDACYARRLQGWTTTTRSAAAIHAEGLRQVERIHAEMRRIITQVGFAGDLPAFFEHLKREPRFYYANDDAGRAQYLADTRAAIDTIQAQLPQWFATLPRAGLDVRRVEAFREANTSAAFYEAPALDGSRPGIYFVPLHDMANSPRWDLMTTAFHEAVPGHHMQIAIAQELGETPLMVRLMWFGAWGEGWALYAERLAAEMGAYAGKPYDDFGRLASELFRAVRLVVDTGIHAQRWSRQQAVDYMLANTPLPRGMVEGEVDRYIVWPGQATSYMTGMLTILELRERARAALGERFDIRQFHDVVLTRGSVPLAVLEANVDAWIAREREREGRRG